MEGGVTKSPERDEKGMHLGIICPLSQETASMCF